MNQEKLDKLIDAVSTLIREIVTEFIDIEQEQKSNNNNGQMK